MALTILNEQYPPRKPKLTLTADSLDELPTEGVAEGSTATVGGTEYVYENNSGWIEPGSGGGGGGLIVTVTMTRDGSGDTYTCNKTWAEINAAVAAGNAVYFTGDFSSGHIGYSALYDIYSVDGSYNISYSDGYFSADSEDAYPSYLYD